MVELSLEVGNNRREKRCHTVQCGRWRLDMRRKNCHSKGNAVVQEVIQKEYEISPSLCVSRNRA